LARARQPCGPGARGRSARSKRTADAGRPAWRDGPRSCPRSSGARGTRGSGVPRESWLTSFTLSLHGGDAADIGGAPQDSPGFPHGARLVRPRAGHRSFPLRTGWSPPIRAGGEGCKPRSWRWSFRGPFSDSGATRRSAPDRSAQSSRTCCRSSSTSPSRRRSRFRSSPRSSPRRLRMTLRGHGRTVAA
jgi:hypothetical protein